MKAELLLKIALNGKPEFIRMTERHCLQEARSGRMATCINANAYSDGGLKLRQQGERIMAHFRDRGFKVKLLGSRKEPMLAAILLAWGDHDESKEYKRYLEQSHAESCREVFSESKRSMPAPVDMTKKTRIVPEPDMSWDGAKWAGY